MTADRCGCLPVQLDLTATSPLLTGFNVLATHLAYNAGDAHLFLSHLIRQDEDTPGSLKQEGFGNEEGEEGSGLQVRGGQGLGRSVEE